VREKWRSNSFLRFVDDKSEERVGSLFCEVGFCGLEGLLVGGPRSDDGFFVLSYMILVVIRVI
jgi:hypothetical protein